MLSSHAACFAAALSWILGRKLTYDPAKRDWTLTNRGLDFEDAARVFDGVTAEVEDARQDYGEVRILCFGVLQDRLVVIGYTPRGDVRHVFSMRKANDREKARFAPYFGL
ncbi:MAG: BrnT family toxin [Betaproteobacteria bacterium]|nr:BrnT family toxin [Betaproteobacteria bacterium]